MSARTGPGNPWDTFAARMSQLDYLLQMFLRAKKNVSIQLGDGASMRADVFTPLGRGPWPVIVSAYPYHKDGIGAAFGLEAYYLVKAGYAVVMADLRGTGASEGVSRDAFDCLRGEDLRTLVEWSAAQKWSNGKLGMTGTSYGGIATLMAAAEGPPSLKAVFASMAPISFYDNVGFPGGSMSMLGVVGSWLNLMNLLNLFPPLYTRDRPDWRATWQARLNGFVPYLFSAADNVTYNDFWRISEVPVEKIKVPTFILDGWRGWTYRDSFELFQRLSAPKKMVIGPWVHVWPITAEIEPINHIRQMVQWFDHWLKGRENGIMKEPSLSVFVMGGNFWKYERNWLPDGAADKDFHINGDGSLHTDPDGAVSNMIYAHDPGVGTTAGLMSLFSLGIDYPREQSEDNLRSLTFDSSPLATAMEIVGEPELTLSVSIDMPDAAITAKLCDVAPDGQSALITHGWLRLSRCEGLERNVPPERDRECAVRIKMWPADYRLRPGHRLRLCIALSDFPHIFPLPYKGNIQLFFGPAHVQKLTLRTLTGDASPAMSPKLPRPDLGLFRTIKPSASTWQVVRDESAERVTVHAAAEAHVPLPYLSSRFNLKHLFDAYLIERQPATATLDATAAADFGIARHHYSFEARQVVTSGRAEVSVNVREDGKTVMQKVLTKDLKWV